jgi:DNA invertase Pin-like site-specific DNA recombinase
MNEYVIAKYIRLSQDDAVSESQSIPNQRLLLDSHIEDLDIPNAQVLEFVDNGFTGTNVERPGFQEMIELIRCGRINCIVVKDFSRFARNALESGYYIEKVFPLYRVRFIAVSDRFDSSDYKDGTGGIDVAFKFMMHEYYSADLSKKVKSALHVLMQNGEHIVGGAIYGYRKNKSGKWEHDPTAAAVVREIFGMALEGKTTAQIRDKLFADRRLAPREYERMTKGKDIVPAYNWASKQIWRILTNEQYTGTYIAGKRETARVGSKKQVTKDRLEWFIFPDNHPPIVGKAEFERVQEILKAPKEAFPSGRERSDHAKKLYGKIENGDRKPCSALFGYRINSSQTLEIDEAAAETVRLIFSLAIQGRTHRDIAAELKQARHIPPGEYFKLAKGQSVLPTYKWPELRIREILKNEQYTGAYIAGKTYQDENGKKYHTPPSEWIVIPDKYPAIVSKEIFGQARALAAQGRRTSQPIDYLLKGKIVCGSCGCAMVYGNTTTQPMYRCPASHSDPTGTCRKMKVPAAEVDDAVMAIIRKQAEVVLNSADVSGFRKKASNNRSADSAVVGLNQDEVEKQISRLSKQRQECYERFVTLEIDRDMFRSLKDDCTKRIDKLSQQLAVFQQGARKREADSKTASLAKDALNETAEPKDIVDALVERVLVFPGNNIEIRWKFADFAKTNADSLGGTQ